MTTRDPASAPGPEATGGVAPPEGPEGRPPAPRRRVPLPSFTAMRYRDFRFYWVSTVTLFVDQGMANVALGWLMLELTDSAAWVAIAVAVRGLPLFLLTMPAGVLADRWDRRRILVVTQVVAAVSAVAFAILVAIDAVNAPILLIYAWVLGSSTAIGLPTRQAIIPMLVPREHLLNAVVTGAMARTSSQLIGPGLAGLLIGRWGVEASFTVQAAFLVISTFTLFPLSSAATKIVERDDRPKFSIRGDLVEAGRFLRSNVPLLVIIGLMVNTGLFMIGPNQALVPVIVRDELDAGADALGLVLMAMATGTLTTSLFLTSMGGMRNKGGFFAMALIGGSICFAGIALSPELWMATAFFFSWGAFGGFFVSMSQSLLQTHTPQDVMGRVMSVNALASQGTMPLGALIAGALASLFDVTTAVLVQAFICAAIATSALLFIPRFRRLS